MARDQDSPHKESQCSFVARRRQDEDQTDIRTSRRTIETDCRHPSRVPVKSIARLTPVIFIFLLRGAPDVGR